MLVVEREEGVGVCVWVGGECVGVSGWVCGVRERGV